MDRPDKRRAARRAVFLCFFVGSAGLRAGEWAGFFHPVEIGKGVPNQAQVPVELRVTPWRKKERRRRAAVSFRAARGAGFR